MRKQLEKLALMYDSAPSQVRQVGSVANRPLTIAGSTMAPMQAAMRAATYTGSVARPAQALGAGYGTGVNRFGGGGYSAEAPFGQALLKPVDQALEHAHNNPISTGVAGAALLSSGGALAPWAAAGRALPAAGAFARGLATQLPTSIAARAIPGYTAAAAGHAAKGFLGNAAHLAKDIGAWSGFNAAAAGAGAATDNFLRSKGQLAGTNTSPLAAAGSAALHTPAAVVGGHALGAGTGAAVGALGRMATRGSRLAEGAGANLLGRGTAREMAYGTQRIITHQPGSLVEGALKPSQPAQPAPNMSVPKTPANPSGVAYAPPPAPKPLPPPNTAAYMPGPSSTRGMYRF
jgi:hypothetical protein